MIIGNQSKRILWTSFGENLAAFSKHAPKRSYEGMVGDESWFGFISADTWLDHLAEVQ